MAMMGFTAESTKQMPLSAVQTMSLGFVFMLVMSYVLAHFVYLFGVSGYASALVLGFWVWLGFLAPTLAQGWLWEGKSFKLFSFNAAYQLLSVEIMALVLSLWR